jgi:prohibitin 2
MKNNPGFIKLRKIEAAREIANTIANSQNRVFLQSDSLQLNLGDVETESTSSLHEMEEELNNVSKRK